MEKFHYPTTLKRLSVTSKEDGFTIEFDWLELAALICALTDEAIALSANKNSKSRLIYDQKSNTITLTASDRHLTVNAEMNQTRGINK